MSNQNNTGKWKLSYVGEALVVSSGLVFLGQKHPKGLNLATILDMIKEHPGRSYYCKVIPRRVTLGEALERNELESLGQVRDTYSSIDLLLLAPERKFEGLPKTGRQLLSKHYKSKPKEVK